MNNSGPCIGLVKEIFLNLDDYDFFITPAIVNILTNAILAVTAMIFNGVLIVTVLRSENLQTPSYLLITSLAAVDFLVGMLYHPFQIALSVCYLKRSIEDICEIAQPFNFITTYLGALSFSMVTCISVDRYLALRLGSGYRVSFTKRRVRRVIVAQWIVGFFLSAFSTWGDVVPRPFVFAVWSLLGFVFFSTTCFYYVKSFKALAVYTSQVHEHPSNFDVECYRRMLKTMLMILGFLLLCHVPIILSIIANIIYKHRKETVLFHLEAITLFGLNSSINPVIYFIRFPDIRRACLRRTLTS